MRFLGFAEPRSYQLWFRSPAFLTGRPRGGGLGPIGQSPVVNGVTNFERAVDYAQPYFGGRLRLATWPVTSF